MADRDPVVRRCRTFRWDDVPMLEYKAGDEAPFKDVTRQTLFARPDLAGELRYFEIAPGGHSTLERHEHAHAVMVLRGRGCCLVGQATYAIGSLDLVAVPAMTWHQFRASADDVLGFLCMVDCGRDRPQLPTPEQLRDLRSIPAVAAFLDGRM